MTKCLCFWILQPQCDGIFREIEYYNICICIWFDGKIREFEYINIICILFDGKIRQIEYINTI